MPANEILLKDGCFNLRVRLVVENHRPAIGMASSKPNHLINLLLDISMPLFINPEIKF
jgi:hypothetical protein